jgi:hypothetical protein
VSPAAFDPGCVLGYQGKYLYRENFSKTDQISLRISAIYLHHIPNFAISHGKQEKDCLLDSDFFVDMVSVSGLESGKSGLQR